jgi:hypothetical protein
MTMSATRQIDMDVLKNAEGCGRCLGLDSAYSTTTLVEARE